MSNGYNVVTEYETRKLLAIDLNECMYSGCHEPPMEGSSMCQPHRDKSRKATARAMANAYRLREKKRLCRRCGLRPAQPKRVTCGVCRVERGQWGAPGRPKKPVLNVELNATGDRIAAATHVDADGRTRYRGKGTRGRQPLIETDLDDLREASKAHGRAGVHREIGEKGLSYYWSAEVQQMTKAVSQEIRRAALGELERARDKALEEARWIDEVLVRNGVKPALVDPADE